MLESPQILPTNKVVEVTRKRGAKLSLPEAFWRDLDQPNDHAAPYVYSNGHYHWVVRERGRELEHRTTVDLDELLYWVFESATFGLASEYEVRHRDKSADFRRLLFNHQLELLGLIDLRWRARCAARLNEVLVRHPFTDDGPRTIS